MLRSGSISNSNVFGDNTKVKDKKGISLSPVTSPGRGSFSAPPSGTMMGMIKDAVLSFYAFVGGKNQEESKSTSGPLPDHTQFADAKRSDATAGSQAFNQVAAQHNLGSAQVIYTLEGKEGSAVALELKNLVGRNLNPSDIKLVSGDITCTVPSRDGAREKTVTLPNPDKVYDNKEDMLSKLQSGKGEFSGSADVDKALLKELGLMAKLAPSDTLTPDKLARHYKTAHEQVLAGVEKDVTRLKTTDLQSGQFSVKLGAMTQLHFTTKTDILPNKLMEIKGTFQAKTKEIGKSQGFSIMKSGDQLYIKGSQGALSKSGYMRLPRTEEMLTARDVREIKRNLSPEAYRQLLSNASKGSAASDDKMLKWAKRLDRWKSSGPISKLVAKAIKGFVVNPDRLKTIINSFTGEYDMLYKNLDGQLKEKPGGLTEIAQNIGSAAKDTASSIKTMITGVMTQFKLLEDKIADANEKLGGTCQDTVNFLAKTSESIAQFQASFDPSSIHSDQDLEKLTTMLSHCETGCKESIGKAIHIVSNELVPLLKSDLSSGQVQNQNTQEKLTHIQTAQTKITGLENLYLMVSSGIDNIRTSALNQKADIHLASNSEASKLTTDTLNMPQTLQLVKTALTALADPKKSTQEKASIAHNALYGQHGVSSTLGEIDKASISSGDQSVNLFGATEGLGSVHSFLTECKSVLSAASDSAKLGDATMQGNLGSTRDPMMTKLSQKSAELEHYKSSLTQSQTIKDTLIQAGNMKLSPHIDSIASDFNKASNSVFSEDSLTQLAKKPEQWAETSNRLLNVQDRIRGEMLRLIVSETSSPEKSTLIDTLQNASDQIDKLMDGHAKFPETMGIGVAGGLDTARHESLSRFGTGQHAALLIRDSGDQKLITVFNKVVQFGRADDLAKLEKRLTPPSLNLLTTERPLSPEVKAALKPFIDGEKAATKGKTDDQFKYKRTLLEAGAKFKEASGSTVEVFAIRQDSAGSIHVTVNRDQKLNYGEQETKEIVFSSTSMVKEEAHRFTKLVNSAKYEDFFTNTLTPLAKQLESASLSNYDVGISDPYHGQKTQFIQKLNTMADHFDAQLADMAAGGSPKLESPFLQSKATFIQGMITEFEKGADTSLNATLLENSKAQIATQAETIYTEMTAQFSKAFEESMLSPTETRINQFLSENFSKVAITFTDFSDKINKANQHLASRQFALKEDMTSPIKSFSDCKTAFSALTRNIQAANTAVDNRCPQALKILEKGKEILSDFESRFDPQADDAAAQLATISNRLEKCEEKCHEALGKTLELVKSDELKEREEWKKLSTMARQDVRQFVSDNFAPFSQISNQDMLDSIKVMTESVAINKTVNLQLGENRTIATMTDSYLVSPGFEGPKQAQMALLSTLKELYPKVTYTISKEGTLTPPLEPFKNDADVKAFQDKLEAKIDVLVSKKMKENGDINPSLAKPVKEQVYELAIDIFEKV